jgi:hypothetical protein
VLTTVTVTPFISPEAAAKVMVLPLIETVEAEATAGTAASAPSASATVSPVRRRAPPLRRLMVLDDISTSVARFRIFPGMQFNSSLIRTSRRNPDWS